MPSETILVAAIDFVKLAMRYDQWDQTKEIPEDEIHILFATVAAAGFDPKIVIPGQLRGHFKDQDGSNTGETYPINKLCPFKVVNQENGDHFSATKWLDCALQHVISGLRNGKGSVELIDEIATEIERSIPLTPIQLTPEGDLLREYPPDRAGFVDHTKDSRELSSCVGIHAYCNCWMDRRRATATQDAIVCRGCSLRVLFPKEVRTYGELRKALTKQVQVPA